MATVRDLKKDINYLATEIITEAYVRKVLFNEVKEADVSEIISKAVAYRNELITRVNNPDGKDNPKLVKAHYQKVRKDMTDQFSEMIEKVNKLK